MNRSPSANFPTFYQRMRGSARTWARSLHRTVPVILIVILPGSLWSFQAMQKAQARLAQPGPFETTGTRVTNSGNMLWIVIVNLATTCVGSSCIISAMEAARAGKSKWLGRGLRKSLRLLGWSLIVTLQAPVRAFLPFLPPPAGAEPSQYQPPDNSLAAWFDRIPICAGISFYLSKFGLLSFAAVLSSDRWTGSAAVTRGHYFHVGVLNLLLGVTGLIGFGLLSNTRAAGDDAWLFMSAVIVAEQAIGTLPMAYGLHLFRDCESASGK